MIHNKYYIKNIPHGNQMLKAARRISGQSYLQLLQSPNLPTNLFLPSKVENPQHSGPARIHLQLSSVAQDGQVLGPALRRRIK